MLRLLDKYCIQARLDPVTPRQLRHTFAIRYLKKHPGDLRGLAALLRHSDLNTVIVYTVPSLEDLAGRLDAVIEAPD
jgi:site-specific recombinase XerD